MSSCFICLSFVYLKVCLFVYLSLCLPVCVSVFVCLLSSFHLKIYILHMYISNYALFICSSCLPTPFRSFFLFVFLFIYINVSLSLFCLFACLSLCLFFLTFLPLNVSVIFYDLFNSSLLSLRYVPVCFFPFMSLSFSSL